MTKAEIENQIRDIKKLMEDSQEKLSELEKILSEKSNEIPPFPEFNNENIYYLSAQGDIRFTPSLTGEKTDDFNAFHSEALAQEYAKISLRTAMLLHCKWYCDRDLITDFSDESVEKWCVWYDHHSNRWTIDCQRTYENTTIYFTTEEAARKAADWMNEHFKFN